MEYRFVRLNSSRTCIAHGLSHSPVRLSQVRWHLDAGELVVALANLAGTATEDFVATKNLPVLGEAAFRAMPVDCTGVMIRRNDYNEFVHVAGPLAEAGEPLERLQHMLQTGSCADAPNGAVTVVSTDRPRDHRWPEVRALVEATGAPVIQTDTKTLLCGNVNARVQEVAGWSAQTRQSPDAWKLA